MVSQQQKYDTGLLRVDIFASQEQLGQIPPLKCEHPCFVPVGIIHEN